ncbi:MAG: hypothetical protein A2161_10690, partial [Candidatus Schekmanbacteria bacterium RBG_13_48_7]
TDWQYYVLSLLVSVVIVWYLFTKIDFVELCNLLIHIHLQGFIAYLATYAGLIVFRALRFHILVGSGKISFPEMILVTMVRNLFVDLLPARLGALSYIYILTRRFGFAFEIGAASLLLSFLFDFLVMVPLLLIAILAAGTEGNIFLNPVFLSFSGLFLLIFIIAVIYIVPILRIVLKTSDWILKCLHLNHLNMVQFLKEKFRLVIIQTQIIKDRGIFSTILVISILVRLFKYASLYYLLYSLLFNEGIMLYNLDFWKVFLCSAGAELSAMLPIQGIAGIGTWAAAWSLVFKAMGFEERLAVLSGLGVHLVTQVVEYTIGIAAILLLLKKRQ